VGFEERCPSRHPIWWHTIDLDELGEKVPLKFSHEDYFISFWRRSLNTDSMQSGGAIIYENEAVLE
jgi:hypothetical protein